MHLDAPVTRIVDGLVSEGSEIERAGKLAVDAGEQVEVERGRDAGCIVVGKHQGAGVLLEVDADDEAPPDATAPRGRRAAGARPRPA